VSGAGGGEDARAGDDTDLNSRRADAAVGTVHE
jgi:hypothetical protein